MTVTGQPHILSILPFSWNSCLPLSHFGPDGGGPPPASWLSRTRQARMGYRGWDWLTGRGCSSSLLCFLLPAISAATGPHGPIELEPVIQRAPAGAGEVQVWLLQYANPHPRAVAGRRRVALSSLLSAPAFSACLLLLLLLPCCLLSLSALVSHYVSIMFHLCTPPQSSS